jgi:hypothetical protein
MRAVGKALSLIVITTFIASCSLFFQSQVSFRNNTSSYTFLAIKLGTAVDYEATLSPGQQTPFFDISGGSYSLYTKGIDGVFYQWPVPQEVVPGYSYTFIFSINSATNTLAYSTYIALQK